MAVTKVWSERTEPNTPHGELRDCTYSAGLMGLVFWGFDKFPLGAFTIAEREALERSDDQPDETGAGLGDLVTAIKRRYSIILAISRISLLARLHDRTDLGFVVQGVNGNLPKGHDLRRWDPAFTGGHAWFVHPEGNGEVRVYDPEAPMGYGGDVVPWATVTKWIGSMPSFITFRANVYAPAKMYSQDELDKLILDAIAADRTKARITWD